MPQHRRFYSLLLFCGLIAFACVAANANPLRIPGGNHGLDFDDLGYSPALGRMLVPAAQSGALVLVDPADNALRILPHIVPGAHGPDRDVCTPDRCPHHDVGTTSADYGDRLIFANDHAQQAIEAVNPESGEVLARVKLASDSDYVRYVAPLHEVWVTEPRAQQIERFVMVDATQPELRQVGVIAVAGGPESLVIDAVRGVAYTNQWKDHTLEITLKQPHIKAVWANSCAGSRGLALAAALHLLFVGCKEGKVVALDLDHGGRVTSSAEVGAGVDIIAWNPALKHLYAPGAVSANMSVLALGPNDTLHTVATVPTAPQAHCVISDAQRQAYVCDPRAGALIVYRDSD